MLFRRLRRKRIPTGDPFRCGVGSSALDADFEALSPSSGLHRTPETMARSINTEIRMPRSDRSRVDHEGNCGENVPQGVAARRDTVNCSLMNTGLAKALATPKSTFQIIQAVVSQESPKQPVAALLQESDEGVTGSEGRTFVFTVDPETLGDPGKSGGSSTQSEPNQDFVNMCELDVHLLQALKELIVG